MSFNLIQYKKQHTMRESINKEGLKRNKQTKKQKQKTKKNRTTAKNPNNTERE